MWRLARVIWRNPWGTVKFAYTFTAQLLLIGLKLILLPHLPRYQPLRTQVQRAYWASCSTLFPELIHRLPITAASCPQSRARRIGTADWTAYVIPGSKSLDTVAQETVSAESSTPVIVVYAHGGGYARGEARMYLNYMERWQKEISKLDVDLTFVSVEYPLTDVAPHPAQQNAFLNSYRYILERGIAPSQIIFMGDSAGGGCCLLASIELTKLGLPQPAASIMISPWFDMSLRSFGGGSAYVETDYIITLNEGVPLFAKRWIGDLSGDSPAVNPLYCSTSDFQNLPPQLIFAGGGDFVLPECRELVQLFSKAGLRHNLVVEWGQLHLYGLGSEWIEPSVRSRTDAIMFDWIVQAVNR